MHLYDADVCLYKTHSKLLPVALAGHLKYTDTRPLKLHTYTSLLLTTLLTTAHTMALHCALCAVIMADAAVTPMSPN